MGQPCPDRGIPALRVQPVRRKRHASQGERCSNLLALGPQWYLENQDVKIEPTDKVEIKGSRVTMQGQPALIVAEVKKGDEVLKLRDDAGIPLWAGWRKG